MNKNNKLYLSIVIPAYNGEIFIDNCLHSIYNEQIIRENMMQYYEIIIINDGSKDNTYSHALKKAKEINKKTRKNFIKVIDKENGQYGSVINRGLQEASGRYIKILDVDDSLSTSNFISILYAMIGLKQTIDVIITDYIFDKVSKNKQLEYSWNKSFEVNKIIFAKEMPFSTSVITMHSLIYSTKLLKEINYKQIEGVYYSDSQYATVPLVQAKSFYYLNIPLYRYYIGRDEQSINIKVMVKNRLHQLNVVKIIIENLKLIDFKFENQRKYAWKIVARMLEWQLMLIAYDKSIKNKSKYIITMFNEIFDSIKNDKKAYKLVKSSIFIKTILFLRGNFLKIMVTTGIKFYSKFKLNIMENWD